jgi:hypothetical protein
MEEFVAREGKVLTDTWFYTSRVRLIEIRADEG